LLLVYITMAGLVPFVYVSYISNSYFLLSSTVIGICFHFYPKCQKLKYADMTFNLFELMLCSQSVQILPVVVLCILQFVIHHMYPTRHKNIIHVIFVQWYALYAVYQLFLEKPCSPPWFNICNCKSIFQ